MDLWTGCACFVLLICASQRMSHLCRCPGRLPGVATRCRPHGETSGSWLSTTPAMSLGRYDPCGMCLLDRFSLHGLTKGPSVCLEHLYQHLALWSNLSRLMTQQIVRNFNFLLPRGCETQHHKHAGSECLQHGSYELPLLWRETPVKVSCPVSHIQAESIGPLSICCFPQGLSVNVQGGSAAELLKVNGKSDHYHPIFRHTKVN